MAKFILATTGCQTTTACNNLNLCAGLLAGIEGTMHTMGNAWQVAKLNGGQSPLRTATTLQGDLTIKELAQPYATLLVDACNGFNKLICKVSMWTVCHRWLSSSCFFAFNCY